MRFRLFRQDQERRLQSWNFVWYKLLKQNNVFGNGIVIVLFLGEA